MKYPSQNSLQTKWYKICSLEKLITGTMSTKSPSKSPSKQPTSNQLSKIIINRIIKEYLKKTQNKKTTIDKECQFVIGRAASQFALHICQLYVDLIHVSNAASSKIKYSAANQCEEDGRTKITKEDVIQALKNEGLEY